MNNASTLAKTSSALARTASLIFGLPFDIARANYAKVVRFGLIPDSLLNSALFERELAAAERQTLGLWARRV